MSTNKKLIQEIFLTISLLLFIPLFTNAQETDANGKMYDTHIEGEYITDRLDDESEEIFDKANNALLNSKYEDAIILYDKLISTNPEFEEAYCNRGIAHRKLKNYSNSLDDFDAAIKINPELEEAYLSRGMLFFLIGQLNYAIEDFTSATWIKDDPHAYLNRGLAYKKQKEYDDALRDYTSAIKLDPEYIEAYQNRFLLNAGLGNNDAALKDCNKMIELNSKHGYAYYLRGRLYHHNYNDISKACKDWIKAIELGYEEARTEHEKFCK